MKQFIASRSALISRTSLILTISLVAFPSFASKLNIPHAKPVMAKSVELWKQCEEKRSSAIGCSKIRDGKAVIDRKDFIKLAKVQTHSTLSTTNNLYNQPQNQTPLTSFDQRLLVGFTDFLVDRAKQEARLYLQDQLSEKFCGIRNNKETVVISDGNNDFPQTCQVFYALNEANYSMSGTSAMLQTAIRDDLRSYPDRYFEKKYLNENDSEKKKKWLYARIVAAIYAESRGSRGAAEIVGGLSLLDNADCPDIFCKPLTENAALFWVLSENLRLLSDHLGAAYDIDKAQALRYAVTGAILDNSLDHLNEAQKIKVTQKLQEIISTIDAMQHYRQAIHDLETQATPNQAADLALRLQALLSGVNALVQISTSQDIQSSMRDLQTATELAQAIAEENYPRIVLSTLAYAEDKGSTNRYLPLLTELASAKTSADMQQVFELAAAPAGSYREKFNSDNLTSITAFAGIARSKEWYNHSGANPQNGWQPFLPVGVQYTGRTNGYGVFGAFVSIIDLGPLAASRQNTGTVSSSSNIGWTQAFSPGLYATWNPDFARPLVIGIGASRTSKLVTANTGEQVDATRVQLFFAIDMTLFAFR